MLGTLTKIQKLRRKRIIDAARASFAGEGFAMADMEKIALTAGVGKGTLYRYFLNKEDLFLKTVEQRIRAMYEYLITATANAQSAIEFLNEYIEKSVEYHITNSQDFDLILRSGTSQIEAVVRLNRQLQEEYYQNFSHFIETGIQKGEIKAIKKDIILGIFDICSVYLMYEHDKKGMYEITEIKQALKAILIDGLTVSHGKKL